jgi:hypothetical protein
MDKFFNNEEYEKASGFKALDWLKQKYISWTIAFNGSNLIEDLAIVHKWKYIKQFHLQNKKNSV